MLSILATRKLYPDAEFCCITKLKEFMGMKIIPWEEIEDLMLRFFQWNEIPYHLNHWMCFSDWARFFFLGSYPDTLYLDTDCWILKRFDFENETKVRYSYGNICLLYAPGNGSASRFIALLKEQAKRNVGLLVDFANRLPEFAEPIPQEFYSHKRNYQEVSDAMEV